MSHRERTSLLTRALVATVALGALAQASLAEASTKDGITLYRAGKYAEARVVLERAAEEDDEAALYLGLALLRLDRPADAARAWEPITRVRRKDPVAEEVTRLRTAIVHEANRRAATAAARQRRPGGDRRPAPSTVAVVPLVAAGGADPALGRAVAALVGTNLGGLPGFRVVDRDRTAAYVDAIGGASAPDAATRLGRMLGAGIVVIGTHQGTKQLLLKSSVVSTEIGRPVDTMSFGAPLAEAPGLIPQIAQATAKALGVADGKLSAGARKRLERRHTSSGEALLAYGRALVAKDAGDFPKAREHFDAALERDGGFGAARTERDLLPAALVSLKIARKIVEDEIGFSEDAPTALAAASAATEPPTPPTAEPTARATAKPTAQPTAAPTASPAATREPAATPSPRPTANPTPSPEPTVEPTPQPTAEPTATPVAALIAGAAGGTAVAIEDDATETFPAPTASPWRATSTSIPEEDEGWSTTTWIVGGVVAAGAIGGAAAGLGGGGGGGGDDEPDPGPDPGPGPGPAPTPDPAPTTAPPPAAPPVIEGPEALSATVGETLQATFQGRDPQGGTVTLRATIPAGSSISAQPNPATGSPATMTLVFTPTEDQAGRTFDVTLTAQASGETSRTVRITVAMTAPPPGCGDLGGSCIDGCCTAGTCDETVNPPLCCLATGDPGCTTTAECCDGAATCSSGRCCRANGGTCATGTDCCSGSCSASGICEDPVACVAPGGSCAGGETCCSGSCSPDGVCTDVCSPLGTSCADGQSCCDDQAMCPNTGADALCCLATGSSLDCAGNADCCENDSECRGSRCCRSEGAECFEDNECCTGDCIQDGASSFCGIRAANCVEMSENCADSPCCDSQLSCQPGQLGSLACCVPSGSSPCNTTNDCCTVGDSCQAGVCCVAVGDPCGPGSNCCSGQCTMQPDGSSICAVGPPPCADITESCDAALCCPGLSCDSGGGQQTCCGTAGTAGCATDADCCTTDLSCQAGQCCRTDGNPCATDGECCSGSCNDGPGGRSCGPVPPACMDLGESCTADSCCDGFTCATVSGPNVCCLDGIGTPGCSSDADCCGDLACASGSCCTADGAACSDGSECCSGTCADDGGGSLVCQAAP